MYNLEKKVAMRDLSTDTIDQLVSIEGMITRVSELIPDLRIAVFRCSQCHHIEEVRRDGYRVENPERCRNCNTPGSMVIDHNSGYFVDKQLVKMQEVPDQVPEGETPQCVTLYAHEELFDAVKPGDKVEVTGIYKAVPVKVNRNMSTVRDVFRTFVDVIHYRKQVEGRYVVEGEERDEVSYYAVVSRAGPRGGGGGAQGKREAGGAVTGSRHLREAHRLRRAVHLVCMSSRRDA